MWSMRYTDLLSSDIQRLSRMYMFMFGLTQIVKPNGGGGITTLF